VNGPSCLTSRRVTKPQSSSPRQGHQPIAPGQPRNEAPPGVGVAGSTNPGRDSSGAPRPTPRRIIPASSLRDAPHRLGRCKPNPELCCEVLLGLERNDATSLGVVSRIPIQNFGRIATAFSETLQSPTEFPAFRQSGDESSRLLLANLAKERSRTISPPSSNTPPSRSARRTCGRPAKGSEPSEDVGRPDDN
jgi:hypothetical protein